MSLYSVCRSLAQVQTGTGIVSFSTAEAEAAEGSGRPLRGRRKNFIAPRKVRSFPQHGRNGAVFVLAELDGVSYRLIVELAAEAIKYFQLGPNRGRLRRTFARADHFQ